LGTVPNFQWNKPDVKGLRVIASAARHSHEKKFMIIFDWDC